jgi:hypothetical protein
MKYVIYIQNITKITLLGTLAWNMSFTYKILQKSDY